MTIQDDSPITSKKIALVLTGGGARAAYQVGVLKGIQDICNRHAVPLKLSVIVGASAGAINASYLASHMDAPDWGMDRLEKLWTNLSSDQVYSVEFWSYLGKVLRGFLELSSGDLIPEKTINALLDNFPLRQFIQSNISFQNIQKNIDHGSLDALAIRAINYSTGQGTVFFQGRPSVLPWEQVGKRGVPSMIQLEHIMASTAIPLLFAPVKIDNAMYGDGSLRNHTPLSSAIKLGADKLLIIGVKKQNSTILYHQASFSRIVSLVLNTVLLDAIDLDYAHLTQINTMVKQLKELGGVSPFKEVESYILRPSADIGEIAMSHQKSMPTMLRHFIRGLGRREKSSDLFSYLLFEAPFTTELFHLGYQDALFDQDQLVAFLKDN